MKNDQFAAAKTEERIKDLTSICEKIVQERYPKLSDLAHERIQTIQNLDVLTAFLTALLVATSVSQVKYMLNRLPLT